MWTLPDPEAARVLSLDDDAFSRELTTAFDARLGALRVSSPRVAFPLRRQLVDSQFADGVLVIGDAAHAVHPLAGQGVNLGLRDVGARDAILDAGAGAWTGIRRNASRAGRARGAAKRAGRACVRGINRLYSNDGLASTLLRVDTCSALPVG